MCLKTWSPKRRRAAFRSSVTILLAQLLVLVVAYVSLAETSPAQSSLARPRVALVLGGGSARGLSHIGLLQALEEEGIPVDYIVGTSMGSVVAGLYSAGFSADNLEYMVTHLNIAELFIPTIPPGGGLIDTQRFKTFVDALTDNVDYANLPIPFYSVAINLVSGEEVAIDEGSLSRGIIAGMSVPGMFPPVRIGDEYFVDGGMYNLVPVEVARGTGADLVIAVDVRRKLHDIDHDTLTSNIQLTLRLLLAQNTDAALELADIVIAPDVASESSLDYSRTEHLIAEGYRAAKVMAPDIKAALLALDPGLAFQPRQPGLSAAEFASRMRVALDESAKQGGGESLAASFAFALDSGGRTSGELGLSMRLGRLSEQVPIFGTYASRSRPERFMQTIGLGVGRCRQTCATVFARRIRDGWARVSGGDPVGEPVDISGWNVGMGLQGRVHQAVRYAGEWVPDQTTHSSTWRLHLTAPAVIRYNQGNEWNVTVQHDPAGMYGQPNSVYGQADEIVRGEALFRRYVPWNRAELFEAVSTSTAWYIGAGAQATFAEPGAEWHPAGEIGIAFEGRLFGLSPLRSRLALSYRGGDAVPWSLGWSLGDK